MCTLKTFPIKNTPNGRELWRSISGNFDRFSEIICEFVDNALSNFRKYALDPQTSRKVRIVLREQESWVDVDVIDTGTGIRNIHAALTLGSHCGAESPLNEHGMGLKHALASVDDEGCVWSIQTRTPEDNELDRHLLDSTGRAGASLSALPGRQSPSAAPAGGLRPCARWVTGRKRALTPWWRSWWRSWPIPMLRCSSGAR